MPARSTRSCSAGERRRSTSAARRTLALELGAGIQGGVVERETISSLWLPYVRVTDAAATTERARQLGAAVMLEPREGPVGWRSIVAPPAGAEIALWQPKA